MKQSSGTIRFVLSVFTVTLLTAVLVFAPSFEQNVVVAQDESPLETIQNIYSTVYQQVSPSVVSISVSGRVSGNDMFGDQEVFGSGSGFVIDEQGHIVTNDHVVENATDIVVNFFDGSLVRAELIGSDPDSDIAVIRVDRAPDDLQPVQWADSDALIIGQPVLAIGSPFGQRWTLTSGIISALERTIQGLTNFSIGGVIQTDAPINPGNSGGPLLDLDGRVVGVNAQIASTTGANSGIGFAIPSNLTQSIAQQLIDQGYVSYSYLGIAGGEVTLPVIEALDLPADTRGVVVSSVTPGGPAARAGLEGATGLDDDVSGNEAITIITAINDTPVRSMEDLVSYLARNTQPGDTVTLTVLQDGTEQTQVEVRLAPRPSSGV